MKIFKILLILLVPALGIVSCRKSDLRPSHNCSNSANTQSKSTVNDNNVMNGRIIAPGVNDDNNGTEIVGSGDDDRDGGDKGKKKITK